MTNATKPNKHRNSNGDATDELKDSVVETANAVGHTAELLASDVKHGALNTGKTAHEKASLLKSKATGTPPGEPPVKQNSHLIAKAAVGTAVAIALAGIVITVLRQRSEEVTEEAS